MEKKVLDSMSFNFSNSIRYLYGADGVKRRVRYRTAQSGGIVPFSFTGNQIQASGLPGIDPPLPPVTTVTTMDYCGSAIYENNVLTALLVEGGYVSFTRTGTGAGAVYTPTYHFYMRDHLGSNRVVASAAGTAEQVSHYYPYGSTFYGESASDHRFKYCGKELDKMHGLDWYDSSARYYDHVLGRFHQIDPLCEKYYSWSPYAYCVGNPVNGIDPYGRENIVVVGSNNNNAKGSKLMFVNQGIAQIRRNYEQYGNESNTMVLFIANYSKGQINETKKAIEQYGATLILVNSAQDFIEYINNGNDRQNDKITNMTIFSHGLPGSIDFGYGLSEYATSYKLDKSNVSKLRDSAFKGSKSSIMSYACRSGLGPGYGVLDFDSENSIAQLMANSTKTNVGAFLVKTDYSNTLGNVFQRRIGNATSQYETVDNAILTPHGALSPVIGGSTPWYYLPLPQLFKPQNR